MAVLIFEASKVSMPLNCKGVNNISLIEEESSETRSSRDENNAKVEQVRYFDHTKHLLVACLANISSADCSISTDNKIEGRHIMSSGNLGPLFHKARAKIIAAARYPPLRSLCCQYLQTKL